MTDNFNNYKNKSYRFLSFEGLFSTIEHKSLRFSRADQFNDPLDNSPFLMDLNWENFSKKSYKFIKNITEAAFKESFSSTYICCFSKTYTSDKSYLMWAHYGKSHTQVCFEIDFSKTGYCGRPSEVIYSKNLANKRLEPKEAFDLGMFIVTNKSSIWDYEEEIRLVYDLRTVKDFSILQTANKEKNLDVKFDINLISKVIFGYKSSEFNELKTISMFKNHNHMPEFEKMVIDPFSLDLKPIPYQKPI